MYQMKEVKEAFNFISKKTNHIYGLVNNAELILQETTF